MSARAFDYHQLQPKLFACLRGYSRRDLVSERESEHRRMIRELADLSDELPPDLATEPSVVKKGDVLRPRQPDHDPQSVPARLIEQVAPWSRVCAEGVEAEARHEPEVIGDLLASRELVPGGVGRERAIRHALDEKSFLADA